MRLRERTEAFVEVELCAALTFGFSRNSRILESRPAQELKTYPDNLAAAAAKASALVNRPIVASPHGLEEFPWLLRGISPQAEPSQIARTNWIDNENPAAGAPQVSSSITPSITSQHGPRGLPLVTPFAAFLGFRSRAMK